MDIFEIPQQETKNLERTVVSIFVIEIDTNLFTIRLLLDKLLKAYELATTMSEKHSITLFEM